MWSARCETLIDRTGLQYRIFHGEEPASYAKIISALRDDAGFRSLFNSLLADAPYSAFRWETPPITLTTVSRPFEFVLLESPTLARLPEPGAFAEHFATGVAGVAVFPNLGHDAVMIVPCPLDADTHYGHLAAFVRGAPEHQRHAFWKTVGDAVAIGVSPLPIWLSTAGAGVSWLHVRIDYRPKYYGFEPYRNMAI